MSVILIPASRYDAPKDKDYHWSSAKMNFHQIVPKKRHPNILKPKHDKTQKTSIINFIDFDFRMHHIVMYETARRMTGNPLHMKHISLKLEFSSS